MAGHIQRPKGQEDGREAPATEHLGAQRDTAIEDTEWRIHDVRGETGAADPQVPCSCYTAGPVTDQPRKTIRVVAASIQRNGRYLITQRRSEAVLPNLWEFPGGRVEADETDEEALVREVLHRLGVKVRVVKLITQDPHHYEKYTVDLCLYECEVPDDVGFSCNAVKAFRWVTSDEFDDVDFTPADEASVDALLGER